MNIEGNTIIFKSTFENYIKEQKGVKCNTVRRFTDWKELRDFLQFVNEWDDGQRLKQIKILSPNIPKHFVREITDITSFDGYWIISWRD